MKRSFRYHPIPKSRIATFDVVAEGMRRHHISALLEFDVTLGREKLRDLKRTGSKVSFTAWIIKTIADTLKQYPQAGAFLINKKKMIIYDDVDISILIEKVSEGQKVPLPYVIQKANEKTIEQITLEIEQTAKKVTTGNEMVLNQKSSLSERLYYHLPGFIRRSIWKYMLLHPHIVYPRMGNVVVSSLGAMGRINGWFIPISIHPLSFGIGSVIKKPVVIKDQIIAREILNVTILFDHDIVDGAPMVRMLNHLTRSIENAEHLLV